MELKSYKDNRLFWGFDHEGHDMFMKECEVVLNDCMVRNVEEERSNVFVIKLNMQIRNKDIPILEKKRSNVLSKEKRKRLPLLRGTEKHRLLEATRKVDEVMNNTEVGNITELNDLVYAGAVVITEMLGVSNRKSTRRTNRGKGEWKRK